MAENKPVRKCSRAGSYDLTFRNGSGCPFGYGQRQDEPQKAPVETGKCYYGDYLQVARLLSCQQPESRLAGEEVHDELLFITTHQAYELWFKQILHELWSVHELFSAGSVPEKAHLVVVQRLTRVVKIMKLLTMQFEVLETMTPMDFLDFRGYIQGASGSQSLQFRTIEALLGVQVDDEMVAKHENTFNKDDFTDLRRAQEGTSLLRLVGDWLERTPGLGTDFNFWEQFEALVQEDLQQNRENAEKFEGPADVRKALLADCDANEANYASVFSAQKHAELQGSGQIRLSRAAIQGAILISLYRDQPRFHTAYQILSLLMDLDSMLAKFRFEHVMMVHRMIGNKVGTGGSSGYSYLRSTLSHKYRVFTDLFNLTTLLVPRDKLPALTPNFEAALHTTPT